MAEPIEPHECLGICVLLSMDTTNPWVVFCRFYSLRFGVPLSMGIADPCLGVVLELK